MVIGENLDCTPAYAGLANVLTTIQNLINGDYNNQALMRNVADRLREAKSLYQDLIDLGCEYYV